jgi:hypothetical protein
MRGVEPVSVQILSSPAGASCEIYNKNTGDKISEITTPAKVILKKRQGYFTPPSYRINCILQDRQSQEAQIEGTVTAWYMGNIAFGGVGLVGMLLTDPVSGAMWNLGPETVYFDYEDPGRSVLGGPYKVKDRGFRTRDGR